MINEPKAFSAIVSIYGIKESVKWTITESVSRNHTFWYLLFANSQQDDSS